MAAEAVRREEGRTKAETVEQSKMVREKAAEKRRRPSVPPIASGRASGC